MVESSEEEDDFPSMESVTPQSKIDTIYQSKTEKVKDLTQKFSLFANGVLVYFNYCKMCWGFLIVQL